ncbi:TetR/AcrR family transcriptional regulator [Tepidimonas taiwanensis]|nr:TetR/AcrR family transcriptional regulator [Tepidimonas taiwanensis]
MHNRRASKELASPRGRPIDRSKDRAILRAVRTLLRQAGPAAVTMERVAQLAGISKATLYRRYPNRQVLLESLVTRRATDLTRTLRSEPTSKAEVRAQLHQYVVDLAGLLCTTTHQRYLLALADGAAAGLDFAGIWRRGPAQAHAELSRFLARAHRAGWLCCDDPDDAAELLLGMAVGLELVRSLYRVPLARHRLAERHAHAARVVDRFLSWYAAAPAAGC